MGEPFVILMELAEARFGELSDGERDVLRGSARRPESVDDQVQARDRCPKPEEYASLRTVRRGLLRWLCLSRKASRLIDARGIRVSKAFIVDDGFVPGSARSGPPLPPSGGWQPLELAHGLLRHRLRLRECVLPGGLLMVSTRGGRLKMESCVVQWIDARDSEWAHALNIEHCCVAEQIDMSGVRVGGGVVLSGTGVAQAPGARPGLVVLRHACIAGPLMAHNLRVRGLVQMDEIDVQGSVELSGAQLDAADEEFALVANFATFRRTCYLDCGFQSTGHVRMIGVSVGADLSLSGATLRRGPTSEYVLSLNRAKIRGALLMAPRIADKERAGQLGVRVGDSWTFSSAGQIDLRDASVGRSVRVCGARLENPGGIALRADALRVGRSLEISRSTTPRKARCLVDGMVSMCNIHVADRIDLSGTRFRGILNPEGQGLIAVKACNTRAGGRLELGKGMSARGEIDFTESAIKGDVDATGGRVWNAQHASLTLVCGHFGADVVLAGGFWSHGCVDLDGATIQGQLDCRGGRFIRSPGEGAALRASMATVRDDVLLRHEERPQVREPRSRGRLPGWLNSVAPRGATWKDCVIIGRANFAGARVHGNFDAGGVIIARKKPPDMTSSEPRETSLFLQQIRVHGKLKLGVAGPHQPDGTGAICPVLVGHVELRQAFARRFECAECLLHLPNNKPPVKFVLHGFGFRDLNDTLVNHITAWVEDSSLPPFAPHTYDHCATVLRRLGRTDEARSVLISKERRVLWQAGVGRWWTRLYRPFSLRGVPAVVSNQHRAAGSPAGGRRAETPPARWWWWHWYWVFGFALDFGYRPLKPLRAAVAIFLVAWVVFFFAAESGGMVPAEADIMAHVQDNRRQDAESLMKQARDAGTPEWRLAEIDRANLATIRDPVVRENELPPYYPRFQSLVYTLDVLLPVINLRQSDFWIPRLWWAQVAMWFVMIAGWVLSFFIGFGLTRLVRDADAELPENDD